MAVRVTPLHSLLFSQGARRLDILTEYEAALFVSELFRNLSRLNVGPVQSSPPLPPPILNDLPPHLPAIPQPYCALLCEEGVLPLLIPVLEKQPEAEVGDRPPSTLRERLGHVGGLWDVYRSLSAARKCS